jgi:hypothetical protein
MDQTNKMTPKDFFLHLGVLVTLYMSTIALISFLFAVITIAAPSVSLQYYDIQNARNTIAWTLAMFLVVYPVFVYLLFLTSSYLRTHTEKITVAIRKWFIYLTIFVTAITMIVNAIVLLTTFLQGGEMTIAFLLKIATIFIVVASILWFSIQELRDTFITDIKRLTRVVYIGSGVVIVLIGVGFFITGSPQQARLAIQDEDRVNDLNVIQSEIVSYWQAKQTLPATLEVLNDPLRSFTVPVDAITVQPYEYNLRSQTSFELCATFATSNKQGSSEAIRPVGDYFGFDTFFTHDTGRTCFERTIDPARFPKF